MEDLSLHILDIVENSIMAGATKIVIKIKEDIASDILSIEIVDNGRGMSGEVVKKVLDPFYTTRTTRRVGMGLSLLSQSARESNGTFNIESEPGKGTRTKVTFQYSHIDRKPMGDLKSTFIILITSYPEINFVYIHEDTEGRSVLDSNDI